jgi:hypothetical protein
MAAMLAPQKVPNSCVRQVQQKDLAKAGKK